jgi:uncharacterized protein involved in copper resistance
MTGPRRGRIYAVFGAAGVGLALGVGGLAAWWWFESALAAYVSGIGWALLLWAVVQQ